MKKLKNVKGINTLSTVEQKSIKGGKKDEGSSNYCLTHLECDFGTYCCDFAPHNGFGVCVASSVCDAGGGQYL